MFWSDPVQLANLSKKQVEMRTFQALTAMQSGDRFTLFELIF
jgi:hypothetical protein